MSDVRNYLSGGGQFDWGSATADLARMNKPLAIANLLATAVNAYLTTKRGLEDRDLQRKTMENEQKRRDTYTEMDQKRYELQQQQFEEDKKLRDWQQQQSEHKDYEDNVRLYNSIGYELAAQGVSPDNILKSLTGQVQSVFGDSPKGQQIINGLNPNAWADVYKVATETRGLNNRLTDAQIKGIISGGQNAANNDYLAAAKINENLSLLKAFCDPLDEDSGADVSAAPSLLQSAVNGYNYFKEVNPVMAQILKQRIGRYQSRFLNQLRNNPKMQQEDKQKIINSIGWILEPVFNPSGGG